MKTRRDFLRLSAVTSLAATFVPDVVRAANPHRSRGKQSSTWADVKTILFQGDSITDAGRDRGNYYANAGPGMGGGYVHDIVAHLLGRYPEKGLRFYNRGISGHRVFELADRWDDDCVNLQPDVLSILIGVNDFWHTLGGQYDGDVDVYRNDLLALLARTRENLPDVKLIIGEPFAVEGGTAIDERWKDFHAYRRVAQLAAAENDAVFLPYHTIFAEALKTAPVEYWCPDGVHPSMAGGYLMKEAWLAGFEDITG